MESCQIDLGEFNRKRGHDLNLEHVIKIVITLPLSYDSEFFLFFYFYTKQYLASRSRGERGLRGVPPILLHPCRHYINGQYHMRVGQTHDLLVTRTRKMPIIQFIIGTN